jgi:hypothetical protein
MTQVLAVPEIPEQTDLARRPRTQTEIGGHQRFSLKACSRIRGRERWHVRGLRGKTGLAAAIAVALKGEAGVKEAAVNPLTGRILVRYSPDRIESPVEMLIRQALMLQPMIEQELSRPTASKSFQVTKRILAAELGCTLLKLLVLGGVSCPVGGIWCVAGVVFALRFAAQKSA